MMTSPRPLLPLMMTWLALVTACGDEPTGSPPAISDVQLRCGPAPQGSFVDQDVILELSARVEDPDRDLTEVKALLNAYVISALTDDDADLRYNWTPEPGLDPMLCKGQITVRVEARDSEGRVTILDEIISK